VNDALLIAGAGKELVSALADEAVKRGAKTALSLIPNQSGSMRLADSPEMLDWNPGSPISARNLVLAAENRIGALTGGIIVCAAPDNADAADFSPAGIDFIINNHVKSYMFLARELARRFHAAQSGTLALVLLEEPSSSLLAGPVFGAFKSFAGNLLTNLNTEYFRTAAFVCEEKISPPMNEFAAYIFKTLSENKKLDGGKWFKFTKFKHSLKFT
jgi:NAD(P)-dependent dehydrogenase (short-subunit alcohol dehydrogenase family)